MRYRNIANIDDDSVKAAIEAPPNVGLRNNDRSNIALSWTAWAITNTTSSSADADEQADDQGAAPALGVAADQTRTRAGTAPPVNVTVPIQSTLVASRIA